MPAAVLLLAACAGGGSRALPPADGASAGGPAAAGRSALTFAIKVPALPAAASGVKSVVVAVDSGASQLTAAQSVTLGATGCTSPAPASVAVCSLTFLATPGDHTFSFTAYDGALDGAGRPQGNVLSRSAGVPFAVAASGPTTVYAALQGVPAGIAIVPGARQDVRGSQHSGFDVYGVYKADGITPFARTFSAVATDAAGAYLLGPDAPEVAIVSSDPGTLSNGVASPNDASTFAVTGVSYNTKRMELAVSAIPRGPAGGVPVGVHVPLRIVARNAPRIYVMDHLSSNVGKVWVFDEEGNQVSVGGAFPGLNGGIGIGYDERAKRLYVSNEFSNTITAYDLEGNPIAMPGAFPNLYFPLGLYVDNVRGRVYAGNFNGGIDNQSDGAAGTVPCNVPRAGTCGITVYDDNGHQLDASGTWREREGVVPYLPYGILADPAAMRVYVSDAGYNRAEAYDVGGHALFSWPTGAGARGLAQDAFSKDLYVADDAACVSRYDRRGGEIPLAGGSCSGRDFSARDTGAFPNVRGPIAVRQNPANGWLYVANYANNSVTAYDRDGNQIALRGKNLNGGPFGFNGSTGVVNGPIGIEVVP